MRKRRRKSSPSATLSPEEWLKGPVATALYEAKEVAPNRRAIRIRLSDEGLHLYFLRKSEEIIPFAKIKGWEFSGRYGAFSYEGCYRSKNGSVQGEISVVILLQETAAEELRESFSRGRMQRRVELAERDERSLWRCPHCHLYDLKAGADGPLRYCPECHAISGRQGVQTVCGGYLYNFTKSGLFAIVGTKRGVHVTMDEGFCPYLQRIAPIFEKVVSHACWLLLFTLLGCFAPLYVTHLSGRGALLVTSVLSLLIFSSFCLTCAYLTSLLLRGGPRVLFFPPLWERVSRLVRRGALDEAEELVSGSDLQSHPGMLANLALGFFARGAAAFGWKRLKQAIELCPNHPALLRMAIHFATDQDRPVWRERLAQLRRDAGVF